MEQARVVFNVVEQPDDPRIAAIGPLFEGMYAEMVSQGAMMPLAENGAALWISSMANGLERFGRLAVAMFGDEVIGFAHGAIKLAPEHLGGERVGHVSHVFVLPAHRRAGVARSLVASLDEWFAAKKINNIELSVVHGNAEGIAFWRSLGYTMELVQLRRH